MLLVIRDYFTEFSKLVENQNATAAVLSAFFEGTDSKTAEREQKILAKIYMKEILSQKKEGLLPPDKEQSCILLAELLFRAQLALLHIPELFRVYHVESQKDAFATFLPEIQACCQSTCRFAMPLHAKDRFLRENAREIYGCCLAGFKKCKQFEEQTHCKNLRSVELLFLKDIDEEFASFFLLNLKFAHCAQRFPM